MTLLVSQQVMADVVVQICYNSFVSCLKDVDVVIPEVAAPPKKETAWERGLKLAKEVSTKYYYVF